MKTNPLNVYVKMFHIIKVIVACLVEHVDDKMYNNTIVLDEWLR
jgi:hypothetical protein